MRSFNARSLPRAYLRGFLLEVRPLVCERETPIVLWNKNLEKGSFKKLRVWRNTSPSLQQNARIYSACVSANPDCNTDKYRLSHFWTGSAGSSRGAKRVEWGGFEWNAHTCVEFLADIARFKSSVSPRIETARMYMNNKESMTNLLRRFVDYGSSMYN